MPRKRWPSMTTALQWAELVGHRPQQHPTCRDVFRRERRQPGRPGFHNPTTDQAQGVNDSGVIVGESAIASGTSHAFVYGLGGNNTMQDMNTVFGSSGYNIIPSGWTLTDAYGIDNDGDIAGFASNGTYNRAFLIAASVPEPCTLLLAAIGLAGLLAYAWKKRQ